jgi:hypothetical protein
MTRSPVRRRPASTLPGTAAPVPAHDAARAHLGLWVTDDGYVRHALLPDGRYVEARGNREAAYRGRYAVNGDRVDYVDDTGFVGYGEFIDGALHHAGMVLRRRAEAAGGPQRDVR